MANRIDFDAEPGPAMPETIAAAWGRFRSAVLPPDAGPEQVRQLRDSFYAGYGSCLDRVGALGEPDVSEEAGCDALTALNEELRAYARAIGRRGDRG
jgi:hypothetical protein